ncbi:TonB-dependent receptor, partial [Sphingomonas sp.]|uniref:TonB-dependent receptor n=1 Tax=Sphingomonas sp. TaxID=28214 RepID=UPI0035BBF1E6
MNRLNLLTGAALATVLCNGVVLAQAAPAAAPVQTAGGQVDPQTGDPSPTADSGRAETQTAGDRPGLDSTGDIIVTATRRETSLQKTPIAVSAFSQATLDRQQVRDVTDLSRFVPSLQFNQQGDQSAITLTLRGIGNDTAFTEVADPEVAIYIDGIYSPRAQGASTLFYDVERVEVLRGPQGTLFGRNATVGALSIVSAKPTLDSFYGNVDAVAGAYDRLGVRGALNLPVNDKLGFRVAFVTEQNDGYVDFQEPPVVTNVDRAAFVTTGKKYYGREQRSVRLSGRFEPSAQFRWDLSGEYFKDTGGPIIALLQTPRPGTKRFSVLADTVPDQDRYAASIRSNVSLGLSDAIRVNYIAGYNRIGGSTQVDADAGALPPTGGFDPASGLQLFLGGFGENRTVNSRFEFNSHEVQLQSQGERTIEWILGGYFSHETNRIRFDVDQRDGYRFGGTRSFVGSFIQANRQIESRAAFGQAIWNATDALRLTGGLRYTKDKKQDKGGRNVTAFGCPAPGDPSCTVNIFGVLPNASAAELLAFLNAQGGNFSISNNDVKGSWDKLTWLGRVDADLAEDVLGYASVSTGFKSGNIQDGGQTTDPETLTNYELGMKSRLFDRRLTLNLAGYYSDFKGYQVNQVVNTRDANGNIIASQVSTQNARGATSYGVEAELTANFTDDDRLQLAGTVQRTRLKSLVSVDGRLDNSGDPTAQRQLRGNELAHAPRFSATATYEHDFNLANGGSITPRATLHYETRSYLTFFNGDRTNRVNASGQPVFYGNDFDEQDAYTKTDLAIRYNAPEDKYLIEAFVQNLENGRIRTGAGAFGPTRYAPVFLS